MILRALWVDTDRNEIAGFASYRNQHSLGTLCSARTWCAGYMDSLRHGWIMPDELYEFTRQHNWEHARVDSNGFVHKIHPAQMVDEWVKLGKPDPVPHKIWSRGKQWGGMSFDLFKQYPPEKPPAIVQRKLPKFFKAPPIEKELDLEAVKQQNGFCF